MRTCILFLILILIISGCDMVGTEKETSVETEVIKMESTVENGYISLLKLILGKAEIDAIEVLGYSAGEIAEPDSSGKARMLDVSYLLIVEGSHEDFLNTIERKIFDPTKLNDGGKTFDVNGELYEIEFKAMAKCGYFKEVRGILGILTGNAHYNCYLSDVIDRKFYVLISSFWPYHTAWQLED